jgi:endonuclease/exonuclease/phosphatase family metal-dependent hydrolase
MSVSSKFTRLAGVLRVFTLNTWFRPPLENRRKEIAAWIDAAEPHLVCLQEVRKIEGEATLADWLAEHCTGTWNVAYGGLPHEDDLLSGNAVLSRWDIEVSETVPLACADPLPKSLLYVQTGGLNLFNAHLTSDPKGALVRENQVTFIDKTIRERSIRESELPPILAGDFNAPHGANAIRYLRGEAALDGDSTFYQDAWAVAGSGRGLTWDHKNPHTPPAYLFDARCDYVFVGIPRAPLGWSGGKNPVVPPVGQVVGAYLACDLPLTGTYASDHYAVVADIRWPNVPDV